MHGLRPAAPVQGHEKMSTEVSVVDVDLFTLQNFGVHFHGALLFCFVNDACTRRAAHQAAELDAEMSYAEAFQVEQCLTWLLTKDFERINFTGFQNWLIRSGGLLHFSEAN